MSFLSMFNLNSASEHIIEEAEAYGKWSGGNDNNKDDRLAGGYENVPTVDIHFTQLGFQEAWLYIVKTYAAPMVTKHYVGYYPDSKPNLMFIGKGLIFSTVFPQSIEYFCLVVY